MLGASPASSITSVSSPDVEIPRTAPRFPPFSGRGAGAGAGPVGGLVASSNPFSAYARGRPGLEESFPSSVANVAAYDIAQRLAGRKAGQIGLGAGLAGGPSDALAASAAPAVAPTQIAPIAALPTSMLGPISNSWTSTRRVDPAPAPPVPPRAAKPTSPPDSDDESLVGSPRPSSRKLGRLRKAADVKSKPGVLQTRHGFKSAVVVLSSDDEKDEDAVALLERVSAVARRRSGGGSPAEESAGSDGADPSRDALLEQLGPEVASALRIARAPADVIERFVDLHRIAKAAHNQLAAAATVPASGEGGATVTEPSGAAAGGESAAGKGGSIWTPDMLYSAFGWRVGGPMTRPSVAGAESGAPAQPAALSLTRYQLIGVNWLYHLFQAGINGILADDMGLGKTVQVCALLRVLSTTRGADRPGPFLVVAPASTLGNWEAELRRWSPSLRVAVFRAAGANQLTFHHELMHGSRKQRVTAAAEAAALIASDVRNDDSSVADDGDSDSGSDENSGTDDDDGDGDASEESKDESPREGSSNSGYRGSGATRGHACGPQTQASSCSGGSGAGASETPRAFDVLLATYTLFDRSTESSRLDRALLRRYRYQAIVLDEGHNVRNAESARYKHLSALRSDFRLLLSGTPVQNSLSELFTLLRFILPALFDTRVEEVFQQSAEQLGKSSEPTGGLEGRRQPRYDAGLLSALRTILEPFMLRRSKAEVMRDLPPKTDETLLVSMTAAQAALYQAELSRVRADVFGGAEKPPLPPPLSRDARDDGGAIRGRSAPDMDADYALALSLAEEEEAAAAGKRKRGSGDALNAGASRRRARGANPSGVSSRQPASRLEPPEVPIRGEPARRLTVIELLTPSSEAGDRHSRTQKVAEFAVASPTVLRALQESAAAALVALPAPDSLVETEDSTPRLPARLSNKTAQSLFVTLRKAALHPLLLRTRYSHRPTLWAIARALWSFGAFGTDATCTPTRVYRELTGEQEPPPQSDAAAAAACDRAASAAGPSLGGMSDWEIHTLCCTYAGGGAGGVACTPDGLLDDVSPGLMAPEFAADSAATRVSPALPPPAPIVAPAGASGAALLSACRLPLSAVLDCGKASHLARVLPDLVARGHRTLLFSCWTSTLDVLEALLNWLGLDWLRLDGSTPVADRQRFIDAFNGGACPVFLLSTKAGGLGLNLTGADTVILYDLSFNPTDDEQAVDRVHRLGQTRPVTVTRLATAGTVEVDIWQLARGKTALADAFRGGPGASDSSGGGGLPSGGFQRLLALALHERPPGAAAEPRPET